MGYASRDKKPISEISIIDQVFVNELIPHLPAVNLTQEQINSIALLIPPIDISGKVDKVTSKSLVDDIKISQIHAPGSDDQNLSDLVVNTDPRLSDARTPTTHIHTNDHASHSDDQDISGKSDVGHTHNYEPANSNIQVHVSSVHAPSNAQKNSDITKDEIEAKLTGELTTHTHPGGSGGLTQAQIFNLL